MVTGKEEEQLENAASVQLVVRSNLDLPRTCRHCRQQGCAWTVPVHAATGVSRAVDSRQMWQSM